MPDRSFDGDQHLDREELRSPGGASREATHPLYPPNWMRDENMRQGFGGMHQHPHTHDEGATPYRSAPGYERERERGRFYGRGPKGYRRSDARLLEEISDRLMAHPDVDASDVEVTVDGGIATLAGTVQNRYEKRIAEYVAEDVMGVDDVNNQLKVRHGFWASLTGERAGESDRELTRTPALEVAKPSATAGRQQAAKSAAARRSTAR